MAFQCGIIIDIRKKPAWDEPNYSQLSRFSVEERRLKDGSALFAGIGPGL